MEVEQTLSIIELDQAQFLSLFFLSYLSLHFKVWNLDSNTQGDSVSV